ncbi:hypothetical protein AVL62_04160 [Serinicoccus chungangensis]|uniref:DUF881 domain-containing protein n=1 Tax=Serinicoccus chungangensis TaxID=767452 RepID=A0A0W8I7J7_9MICO|nr:DUF881 domain-containing protein [Serinicoccus chungangensis]KUG54415.1 hypothetical protein AVL62_04160 [Serinicoccus chungangensis]
MARPGPGTPGDPPRERDPAASMALLEQVLDPPVGPGYSSAAQDRLAQGLAPSSGTRTWLMFGTAVTLGLLFTVTAATLRTPDPAEAAGRDQLIERIDAAQALGDERSEQVASLRADIRGIEQQALQTTGSGSRLAAAELRAGGVALQGPGVEVTLRDADRATDAAPGDEGDLERVTSRDLQLVVNGLWSAGAEAIAINEHRLTSTSAIRFAGQAIIVDFRGLTPPYVVRAIGDPQALQEELTSGMTGAYLRELDRQFGLGSEVVPQDRVVVGAGARLSTREGRIPTELAPQTPEQDDLPGSTPTREEPR